MADALSKLRPALPPKPPAAKPGALQAAQGLVTGADASVADAAGHAPGLWLGGAVVFVLVGLCIVAGAGWWWRVRRPARRLRRALQQWQRSWTASHRTVPHDPALAAQALQVLARRHGCRPGADWQAAVQRLMFAPVAPPTAWQELTELARQLTAPAARNAPAPRMAVPPERTP